MPAHPVFLATRDVGSIQYFALITLRAYAIAFRVRTLLLPKHVLVHLYPFQLHKYLLLGRLVAFVRV